MVLREEQLSQRTRQQMRGEEDEFEQLASDFVDQILVPTGIAVVSGTVAGFVGNELSERL